MSADPLEHPIIFSDPRWLTEINAWHAHIPFAFFVVSMLQPRLIVELGAHKGDSYCAFCQAVDVLELPTRCLAVDTWTGDGQAGFYGPEVLEELRRHHDPLYGAFSKLVQSTFDEAAAQLEDGSIDLLHIDGCHSYEAVKHDFELWRPKLSTRGVLLLHDTAVSDGEFGVWRLWKELEPRFPSFNFDFWPGLGVLAVGERVDQTLLTLLDDLRDPRASLEELFRCLGERIVVRGRVATLERRSLERKLSAPTHAPLPRAARLPRFRSRLSPSARRLEVSLAREAELRRLLVEAHGELLELDRGLKQATERLAAVHSSAVWRYGSRLARVKNSLFGERS